MLVLGGGGRRIASQSLIDSLVVPVSVAKTPFGSPTK